MRTRIDDNMCCSRSQLVRSGRGEADPVAESVAAVASSRCTAQAARAGRAASRRH